MPHSNHSTREGFLSAVERMRTALFAASKPAGGTSRPSCFLGWSESKSRITFFPAKRGSHFTNGVPTEPQPGIARTAEPASKDDVSEPVLAKPFSVCLAER